jgi:hypothetical protein
MPTPPTDSIEIGSMTDGVTAISTDVIPVKRGAGNRRITPGYIQAMIAAAAVFQPIDADLTALAGLTSAANKLPYFSGSAAAALADFTAAGRALVDDADAAAQRTTLGLGTIATQAASGVNITGGAISGITDLPVADGGTGASTASGARTNLGLVIGTNVPALTLVGAPCEIGVAVSDESTAITTGTAKLTFRMPYAMTLTAVRASVNTVSSSGNPAIDLNEAGVSVFSTTLTIDANEKTSTTAATPAVISDSALADDAEMTVDIDTAGTGAKGLKLWLIGTRA